MAVALLEYRLNLDTTVNYFYRGSGTVVINGTSGDPFFESAVAFANAGFYDGEWVYDYDHNIWKITKVTFALDGSVASTGIASNVAWDDRLTATYL